MSFQTDLFRALNSSYTIEIDGYTLDTWYWGETTITLELPDGENTQFEFDNQMIEIDDHGVAPAIDLDGNRHMLQFRVSAPLTEALLVKERS